MKEMNSRITIGNLVFENLVSSFRILQSRKNLTQSAIIRIPRYGVLLDPEETEYKIKVRDEVKIEVAYDDEFVTEFEGYVSEISPMLPLEITCEDEMFLLKETQITESWRSISLANLLKYLIPGVQLTQVPDITLAPFRLNRVSKYNALKKLKEEYLLDIYYRNKKLYAGFPYYETGLEEVVFNFQENVPKEEGLKLVYKLATDVKVKIKAISLLPDNTKLEVEVGDDDGDIVTIHFNNITSTTALNKLAEQKKLELKYDGYRGKLKTFGWPVSVHSGIAQIINNNQPERNGRYFIDSVEVTYDGGGYRRDNELGKKVA